MKERAHLAAILAGGRDSRLVSTGAVDEDKGAIDVVGSPLYSHVVDRLIPQADALAVVAPERPDWFDALPEGARHIPDATSSDGRAAGPSGGLLAALKAAGEIGEDAVVLTTPIDSPFLPDDLYWRLGAALEASGAAAALAASRGKLLPTFGLWRASLADQVADLLEDRRNRSLHNLVKSLDAVEVMAWDDVTLPPPFFTVGTEEELVIARDLVRLAAFRSGS